MPKIAIPPPYRGPTHGEAEVEVPPGTVAECLDAAEARFPGFRAQILDASGAVHGFVKLFRNGDRLTGEVLTARLEAADRLEVLTPIAGG